MIEEDIARSFHRTLRVLVVATVVVYLVLAGLGLFVWIQQVRVAQESAKTKAALCALRTDLQTRIRTSEAFLRENPNGIPGISPKVIQDGLRNQQSTVRALAVVECPE